jgi:hypothetical protein
LGVLFIDFWGRRGRFVSIITSAALEKTCPSRPLKLKPEKGSLSKTLNTFFHWRDVAGSTLFFYYLLIWWGGRGRFPFIIYCLGSGRRGRFSSIIYCLGSGRRGRFPSIFIALAVASGYAFLLYLLLWQRQAVLFNLTAYLTLAASLLLFIALAEARSTVHSHCLPYTCCKAMRQYREAGRNFKYKPYRRDAT